MAGVVPSQPPTCISSTAARADCAHEAETHQVTFRAQGVNSRADELLARKQASNFRPLQRKVPSIKLDTELGKWEFDDLLKTFQFRWSVIDALHLEIDSELEGKNQEYDAVFYHYEQLYEDIKRAINRSYQVCVIMRNQLRRWNCLLLAETSSSGHHSRSYQGMNKLFYFN
ncbi:unnamed protein product [Euphydryas editha]|uniref:Uncharacterized protein n=1 Tax=Euphydryas editha TaxID=104508 RepID=A0AAU9T972_EUPED|nr:unnamed protein product [Euphydryas editha]